VIVVEHDEETIRTADYVIDLGPGAGEHGGELIFQGTPAALVAGAPASLTGAYLKGERAIPVPESRRPAVRGHLVVRGARGRCAGAGSAGARAAGALGAGATVPSA